jgi:putative endonuclease
MPTWTIYLLKCADNSHYTGCTSNITERLNRHAQGEVHYTKSRLPVEVETKIVFTDKYKAYEFEKYLKSGSGIAFRNNRLIS